MSVQWEITRSDLKHSQVVGKLYSAEKFAELNDMLRAVVERFDSIEAVKTFARSIVEEVSNIINENRGWYSEPLKVRTTFNRPDNEVGRLKVDIIYSGDEYWDPIVHDTRTVIGSKDKFRRYNRDVRIESGRIHIVVHIEISATE